MSGQIPNAKLRVEALMTHPPKPIGFGVISEGECQTLLAVLTLEEVYAAVEHYQFLMKAWEKAP